MRIICKLKKRALGYLQKAKRAMDAELRGGKGWIRIRIFHSEKGASIVDFLLTGPGSGIACKDDREARNADCGKSSLEMHC